MMKTKNKYLLNKRLRLLKFAKIVVAKDGLTSNTFKNISKKYDLNIDEMNLLFPGGKNDFLQFVLEQLNIDLENYCKKLDLIRLPVHKRIRKILLSKIYIMDKEKKFYKKIFLSLLIPKKNYYIGITLQFIKKYTKRQIIKTNISFNKINDFDEILLVGSGKGIVALNNIPQLRWKNKRQVIYKELQELYNLHIER